MAPRMVPKISLLVDLDFLVNRKPMAITAAKPSSMTRVAEWNG